MLRREMRALRRSLDAGWVAEASRRIQDHVMALREFQQARSVGCYLALPYEVQTRQLMTHCHENGKRVCVPAWNEETGRYEMAWLDPGAETLVGRWNISEPAHHHRAGAMDVDLIVVPALAFDRHGRRLGHGGGHYDRMLGSWSGVRVGAAFAFQCFDDVPSGRQDIPVDLVVNENGVFPGEGHRANPLNRTRT